MHHVFYRSAVAVMLPKNWGVGVSRACDAAGWLEGTGGCRVLGKQSYRTLGLLFLIVTSKYKGCGSNQLRQNKLTHFRKLQAATVFNGVKGCNGS